ncbi:tRNA (guanosine(46)-N7)-methyltransferase TrmB [Nitratiruptor tergarcus]|uniref:tRNA (guanine-N(7)-)-methyltransferase n=1 Tax=Nitratiruptor tergarcus DSM 16512 TaxID=1069081 RepID=A0A1W1WT82_9BACT|nr:tRNA (guanosine(46)-N7)-methyltransferase TrmB [Nitratiruptor tergarcus]SMC09528.1 tRNA (guanine-N7-)-methyltransferase [Nitratiruptor tergarcus DSM 16512]
MPHIVVKSYKEFTSPVKSDGYEFLWFAKEFKNAKDTLVAVRFEEHQFLLAIKPKDEHYIIKGDKITRIAPTYILKGALKHFCELADCEILYDNLSSIKPIHVDKAKSFLKEIDYFIEHFPTKKEVWIEIGFGSGRHLLYQAKNNPDIQFIGIEIHKPSIEQLLKQIALQDIHNLLVIDYDARLFLEFVPSNIVGKIFVHFPVPWDKKPHRRVISKKFIQEAERALKPDGVLELRTDSRAYFDYALELFLEREKSKLEVTKNIEPPVSSKYEDRWVRLGKDIYDIRMYALQESPPLELNFDFTFSKISSLERFIKNFDIKPKVFDDYFVHFEKLYMIEDGKFLAEVSFGSFDRPTHLYLILSEGSAQYYPKKPIASQANIKAHKKIEEFLNV